MALILRSMHIVACSKSTSPTKGYGKETYCIPYLASNSSFLLYSLLECTFICGTVTTDSVLVPFLQRVSRTCELQATISSRTQVSDVFHEVKPTQVYSEPENEMC